MQSCLWAQQAQPCTRRRTRRLGIAAPISLIVLTFGPLLGWAIQVSPRALFIDSRSRSGQLTLTNPGTGAEEVRIEARFGYLAADSAGRPVVRMVDDPSPEQPSAAGWLRIEPRRVVVRPGGHQVVRIVAEPPADLPRGEYWARLIVTSQGVPAAGTGADTAVRAGVSLVVSTVMAVSYRNGGVETGIRLDDFRAEAVADSLISWVGLTRQGNAAYLGTTWVRLRDASGRVVRAWGTPMAVYYSLERRYAFALDSVPPGRYTAELEVTTARADLSPRHILPAAPIHERVEVEVR